jgi:dTDP-4-amino-4,6-dideoxygalactose transaminase
MNIPLFDLNYDHREQEAVTAVLQSRWISIGEKLTNWRVALQLYMM